MGWTTGMLRRRIDEVMKPLELTEQEQANLLYALEGEGWMVTAPIQLPEKP